MKQINILMLIALVLLAIVSGCGKEVPAWIKQERALAQDIPRTPASAFMGENGTFVMRDVNSTSTFIINEQEANKGYAPLATLRIPLALMAQKAGELDDTHNLDFDLAAIEEDVLVQKLGAEKLKQTLKQLRFGQEASDGTMHITAREQVEFLTRLYTEKLPYDQKTMKLIKESMIVSEQAGLVYAGITASGEEDSWYVGYVSAKEKTYVFATHLTGKKQVNAEAAKEMTETILKDMNVLPPETNQEQTLSPM